MILHCCAYVYNKATVAKWKAFNILEAQNTLFRLMKLYKELYNNGLR